MFHTLHEDLQACVRQYSLEERSKEDFWLYLEAHRQAEPEEFAELYPNFERNVFTVDIETIALTCNWPFMNFWSISVRRLIVYQKRKIGKFGTIFTLSGEYISNYFDYYR